LINDILLAVIQGLTEWWPISSSALIILISRALGYSIETGYIYALTLHLPSGLSILTLYFKDYVNLLKDLKSLKPGEDARNYLLALTISIIVGYPLFKTYIELSEEYGLLSMLVIGIGLITTSIIIYRLKPGLKHEVSMLDYSITGFLQGVAVLPGFSRSGLTTGYLCIRGYRSDVAVKISLMLGAPVLIGAGLYSLVMIRHGLNTLQYMLLMIIVYFISLLSARLLVELSRRLKPYLFTIILAILVIVNILLEVLIG